MVTLKDIAELTGNGTWDGDNAAWIYPFFQSGTEEGKLTIKAKGYTVVYDTIQRNQITRDEHDRVTHTLIDKTISISPVSGNIVGVISGKQAQDVHIIVSDIHPTTSGERVSDFFNEYGWIIALVGIAVVTIGVIMYLRKAKIQAQVVSIPTPSAPAVAPSTVVVVPPSPPANDGVAAKSVEAMERIASASISGAKAVGGAAKESSRSLAETGTAKEIVTKQNKRTKEI